MLSEKGEDGKKIKYPFKTKPSIVEADLLITAIG